MNNINPYSITETKDVEQFFHGYAADFDSIYGHTKKRSSWDKFLDRFFRVSMRERFELVLQHSNDPAIKTVLDVGCGGGVYCEALIKQGKKVVGLDIAEGMLQLAREKNKVAKLNGQIQFVHSGYLEHPFEEQFDAAVLVGFFDYIKNPIDIFEKLQKEVSGTLLMSFPVSGGLLGWQRKIRYHMRNCPLYYYNQQDLEQLMAKMGWSDKATITRIHRDFFVHVKL